MRVERFGEVTVRITGGEDREGGGEGPLVVLMHGFGAPGTDLVGLWRVLGVPKEVRFAFPEAPDEIPGMPGARAWWMLDLEGRETAIAEGPRSYADAVPEGMELATDRLVTMLGALRKALRVSEDRLVLGGFSQGSMAACNVAFTRDVSPAGLIVLSGTPVHLDAWKRGMTKRQGMRVFQSHGERDPLLSFRAAKGLHDTMRGAGLRTEWVPFRGGHEIPMPVLEAMAAFVRSVFALR